MSKPSVFFILNNAAVNILDLVIVQLLIAGRFLKTDLLGQGYVSAVLRLFIDVVR